ncbi:hypothetical protein L2E82_24853 [Cichorium intybus]|uniref:Uncharacterized protein n=1 Tax=Cichorium intybus TaxID=13427 RepID=A0ACB9E301_CICIN|nr:hypothetical protein L2E82_24853 [Cichorium intybus]
MGPNRHFEEREGAKLIFSLINILGLLFFTSLPNYYSTCSNIIFPLLSLSLSLSLSLKLIPINFLYLSTVVLGRILTS